MRTEKPKWVVTAVFPSRKYQAEYQSRHSCKCILKL